MNSNLNDNFPIFFSPVRPVYVSLSSSSQQSLWLPVFPVTCQSSWLCAFWWDSAWRPYSCYPGESVPSEDTTFSVLSKSPVRSNQYQNWMRCTLFIHVASTWPCLVSDESVFFSQLVSPPHLHWHVVLICDMSACSVSATGLCSPMWWTTLPWDIPPARTWSLCFSPVTPSAASWREACQWESRPWHYSESVFLPVTLCFLCVHL